MMQSNDDRTLDFDYEKLQDLISPPLHPLPQDFYKFFNHLTIFVNIK